MRVLIVEDESAIRDNIVEMFELMGITVESAINGQDALNKLNAYQPEIILCDLMMPIMNGFEFIENLRKISIHEKTPLIFVSARAEVSEREKALEAGAIDYITKPFNFKEIFEKLEKYYIKE